ncbi:MAG: 4-(cytidine 5'-diphospho)-2-C-methyl-D-erythritol kinase [Chitinophagaceae bacterium]|nr:4-(cytidine 5'-diphospho)-2-C-methyl-D-erythritol kinase [Chitinophagaceae bacterium]
MIVFPHCKINLGLRVLSKRPDGYHNIETVFYPLNWQEGLELIQESAIMPSSRTADEVHLSSSGLSIPGSTTDNICVKAYYALKKDFSGLPPVKVHLHKTIPTGAGLGGGSSNGAFTLMLLNRKFNLGLTSEQLLHYALSLGSDCPFFILNQPCYATGRGEVLSPVPLQLNDFSFLIVYPAISIQTAWAFSTIVPSQPSKPVNKIVQQPIASWRHELENDFEPVVFGKYPEIGIIKKRLYEHGALYASLTGTGSSVYGIFTKNTLPEIEWDSRYIQKKII